MDAAEQVVREEGASRMTMDAVALKAGVSKGGLMYHFPSQRDLLKAMLDRFTEHWDARAAKAHAELPAGTDREIKSYILAWFGLGGEYQRTASALLATITRDPGLLKVVRKTHMESMTKILKTAPSPERATILLLATQGMWMSELLNISPFTNHERARIKRTLLRLVDECCAHKAAGSALKMLRSHGKMQG